MDSSTPNNHVSFEGESSVVGHYPKPPAMASWVIKHSGGLVRSESQATYVLVGLIVVINIIALTLIFGMPDFSSVSSDNIDPSRILVDT